MQKEQLKSFTEYNEERFTKRVVYKEGESTVFVLNFAPNQALPTHKHPGSQLFVLILEGGGTFTIDNKEVKVVKHDIIHCTGEEEFAFVNDSSENTSLYVMLTKIPNENYAKDI